MNELTILLVMILFPGVLLTIIYDNYTEHGKWDSFKYILYSIVSGILTYCVLQLVIIIIQFLYDIKGFEHTDLYYLTVWDLIKGNKNVIVNPVEILIAGGMSIFLGLFAVKIERGRSIHNFLIKLNITDKYGDDSAFIKTINTIIKEYVTVIILDEDMTIQGIVYCYNDKDGIMELSFKDAIVFATSTGCELYKADYCYIAKEFGKLMIYKSKPDDN